MNTKTEVITMSHKEVDRLEVMQCLIQKQISQLQASVQLSLSTRQVRRLQKAFLKHGAKGLISKHRHKVSNNKLSQYTNEQALTLLKTTYTDFGPTFAHEKLTEVHKLKLSVESLRQLMIKEGLWRAKSRKQVVHHQMRTRRPSFGELVQIDGSVHDWFEGRAAKCCLLVFIDDATSKIVQLLFVEEECTQGYFDATQAYIKEYGRPIAFYSDRHSIFRVNIPEAKNSTGETQLGRAMRELGIDLICANSPQAKGRVERANRTLQDRLIKEMRLKKIRGIKEGNAFLSEFLINYNSRFAVEPANSVDAHRKELPSQEVQDLIFSIQSTRSLSKNLETSYNNIIYQIQTDSASYAMRQAKITVCDNHGAVTLLYKNKSLPYKTFDKNNRPAPIVDAKQLDKKLNKKVKAKPKKAHPWRCYPSCAKAKISSELAA